MLELFCFVHMLIKSRPARFVYLLLFVGIHIKAEPNVPPVADNSFGHLPVYFEANHGQVDPAERFISRGVKSLASITGDGLRLSLKTTTIAMRIVDANPKSMHAEGKVDGVSNYYLGGLSITGLEHSS